MAVTIRDVAREAGVAIGTVSRVFNNSGPVKASTRKRVEEAAHRLGYYSQPCWVPAGLRWALAYWATANCTADHCWTCCTQRANRFKVYGPQGYGSASSYAQRMRVQPFYTVGWAK